MPDDFKCGYIARMGFPNVGKSTLLNRLVGDKLITSPKPQTTRHRLLGIVNLPEAQFLFLDTPGVLDPKGALNASLVAAALNALSEANVVVWLVEPRPRTTRSSCPNCGAMLVMDDSTCVVDCLRAVAVFFEPESCGQWTPCREGTPRLLQTITRICRGRGRDENLAFLERLAATLMDASFCPLGQSAAVPWLSALKNLARKLTPTSGEKDARPGSAGCPNVKSDLNHPGGNRTPSAGFLRPSAPQDWGFFCLES